MSARAPILAFRGKRCLLALLAVGAETPGNFVNDFWPLRPALDDEAPPGDNGPFPLMNRVVDAVDETGLGDLGYGDGEGLLGMGVDVLVGLGGLGG